MIEKDDLLADDEKTVSGRFIKQMVILFNFRVPASWARFESYLDILLSFGLHSADEVLLSGDQTTKTADRNPMDSEACRVGLSFYAKMQIVEHIGDLILGEESPLFVEG